MSPAAASRPHCFLARCAEHTDLRCTGSKVWFWAGNSSWSVRSADLQVSAKLSFPDRTKLLGSLCIKVPDAKLTTAEAFSNPLSIGR